MHRALVICARDCEVGRATPDALALGRADGDFSPHSLSLPHGGAMTDWLRETEGQVRILGLAARKSNLLR